MDQNQDSLFSNQSPEEANPHKKCYDSALAHLARKDYSRHKLKKKLREKGHESPVINEVLDELIEKRFLREEIYKEGRIKGLLRKGYSYGAVSYKMAQEMCPATEEEILAVANEMELGPDHQLWDLVSKKVRIDYDFVSNKKKLKERTLRYVVSRGHNLGKAADFYDQIIKEYQENEENFDV